MNKKFLTAAIAVSAVAIGGFALATTAFASDDSSRTSFAERLASKLGLSTEVVETAMEETRDEAQTERLDDAVAEGTITEEQKTLIVTKQEEIEAKLEEIRAGEESGREEIHDLMQKTRDWAEENDIPVGLVRGGGMMGRGGHGGMGGGMMNGECSGECDGSCME